MEVLCISNGHGEDQIAARICVELQQSGVSVIALPLVGVGHAYRTANIPIVEEATQAMPSGGFVRMDSQHLWRDMRSGLASLTWRQLRFTWRWSRQGKKQRLIFAVGDIVPLLFAWLPTWWFGCDYAFIATAKSEYHWRDRKGKLPDVSKPWSGSVFYPWERSLMRSLHCRAAFVRDLLTAEELQKKFRLPVLYYGNPMMDGLEPKGLNLGVSEEEWTIALLPGSRAPEVYDNWVSLTIGAQIIVRSMNYRVNFLAAIAEDLDIGQLSQVLQQKGWTKIDEVTYKLQQSRLKLVTQGFSDCLHACHLGLAMAGTATEQLVGLGKPAISMPGGGPQFTRKFAKEQAHLLGLSVILVDKPAQVGDVVANLLNDPDYFQEAVTNGRERMGEPGASRQIAQHLVEKVLR